MTFTLETFERHKHEIIEQFEQLGLTYDDLNNKTESALIREIKQELLAEYFQIAVVGEFSRGKSMFINALMGQKILPSSAVPTTTILNMISYAKEPSIRLHYHDSSRSPVTISREQFDELVAPMEPLIGDAASEREYAHAVEIIKSIHHAEIGFPVDFCRHGVQLVDTPGTNDLDPGREQITNRIIPQSDAAILLLSAVKILSESEMSFLRDRLLASDIQKIFIVINFKDELSSKADEEKILEFAHQHLKEILGSPKLFLVSARDALNAKRQINGEVVTGRGGKVKSWSLAESGLPELESALSNFLETERGPVKLAKPVKRAQRSIREVADKQLRVERAALTNTIADLEQKVQAFRPKLTRVMQNSEAAMRKFEQEMKKEEEAIVHWYEGELQKLAAKGLALFDSYRHRAAAEINRAVEDGVAPLERELHLQRKQKIIESVQGLLKRSSRVMEVEMRSIHTDFEALITSGSSGMHDHDPGTLIKLDEVQPEYSIFGEILNELDTAWETRTSFIGKAIVGTGIALTAIIGGLAYFIKGLFSGVQDPKDKMRQQLIEQFRSTRLERAATLRREWKSIEQSVRESFTRTVKREVHQIEEQLWTLQNGVGLEQREIQVKLEKLARHERKLQQISERLEELLKGIIRVP